MVRDIVVLSEIRSHWPAAGPARNKAGIGF